jgi:hypothetical protein
MDGFTFHPITLCRISIKIRNPDNKLIDAITIALRLFLPGLKQYIETGISNSSGAELSFDIRDRKKNSPASIICIGFNDVVILMAEFHARSPNNSAISSSLPLIFATTSVCMGWQVNTRADIRDKLRKKSLNLAKTNCSLNKVEKTFTTSMHNNPYKITFMRWLT